MKAGKMPEVAQEEIKQGQEAQAEEQAPTDEELAAAFDKVQSGEWESLDGPTKGESQPEPEPEKKAEPKPEPVTEPEEKPGKRSQVLAGDRKELRKLEAERAKLEKEKEELEYLHSLTNQPGKEEEKSDDGEAEKKSGNAELDKLRQEVERLKTESERLNAERQAELANRQVDAYKASIADTIKAGDYPGVASQIEEGVVDIVFDSMLSEYEATKEAPDVKRVLDALEEQHRNVYERLHKIYGKQTETEPSENAEKKPPMPTISNNTPKEPGRKLEEPDTLDPEALDADAIAFFDKLGRGG